jgi:hypothetical protein
VALLRSKKRTVNKMYMKRSIAVLIILAGIWFTNCANAQLSLGAKAGVTYSSLFGSGANEADTRASMGAGFFVNMGFGLLALQPELLWVQKGAININRDYNIEEDFDIQYMEIPVLFKVRLPLGKIYPNAYIGPYYARQLNGTYSISQLDYGAAFVTQDLTYKDDELGAIGGVGLDIVGKRLFYTLDARYSRGLNTIVKEGTYSEPEIRNGYFQVSFGLGIHF